MEHLALASQAVSPQQQLAASYPQVLDVKLPFDERQLLQDNNVRGWRLHCFVRSAVGEQLDA
jgi:hypothetical protein